MPTQEIKKSLSELTPADFEAHPIWRHRHDEEGKSGRDDLMSPVTKLPVIHLKNKIIGVKVQLANGQMVWARFSNVHVGYARRSDQFLGCSLEKNGKWFFLARYFDPMYRRQGPEDVAKFLGLPVDEVFPISYDLRPYVKGDEPPVWGVIPKEPRERLSSAERNALPKAPFGESAEELRQYLKWVDSLPADNKHRGGNEKIIQALADWEEIERNGWKAFHAARAGKSDNGSSDDVD
jgi:hypothetical protein